MCKFAVSVSLAAAISYEGKKSRIDATLWWLRSLRSDARGLSASRRELTSRLKSQVWSLKRFLQQRFNG
jgi:hypothetical protein